MLFLKYFTSTDHKVIGLLYAATSRVKQDVIPGLSQPVWFTPTEAGEWEIPCSQLCGLGHYRMRGFYTIETEAEYQAWLEEEASFIEL